jgi:hypothetical protein
MRIDKFLFAVLLVILYFNLASQAAETPPKVPYIQKNVCPFECCQYGKWSAKTALKVYQNEGNSTSVVFTIKPGDDFTAIKGNVHVVKLGVVTLEKTFDGFTKGDKVYVLTYRGEGVYDLWYKGKIIDSDNGIWANGVMSQPPEIIWWVLVKNKDGKKGWLKLKNISERGFAIEEKIDGMDSCS